MNEITRVAIRQKSIVVLVLLCIQVSMPAHGAKVAVAKVGQITHKITHFKALHEIPASWTIKRYASIARAKPAPKGHIWYVLKGSATNNSSEERTINATTYFIVDGAGDKYKPDVANAMYQSQNTSVVYNKVKPGETKGWLTFFKVPVDATGLKLRANNLTFLSKKLATFNLPDPAKYAAAARGKSPAPASTAATGRKTPAPASIATRGRTIAVGPIKFSLNKVEVMDTIPASRLTGRWKSMKRTTPAPPNHTWYYVEGTATNNDQSIRTVMVESVTLVDIDNKVYTADNSKINYYIEPAHMLSVVRMKPRESGRWATFIAAPKSVEGLRLRVTDLKYKSRNFGYLALSADGPSGPPAATVNRASTAPVRKKPPARIKTGSKRTRAVPTTSTVATKPAAPIALTTVTDRKMGFSILIPKKAKVAMQSGGNIVYQHRQPPQFYQVSVMDNLIGSFEGAEKMATANGLKKLKSKQKISNGLILITHPLGAMQDIWIFKNGVNRKIIANCMGTANVFQDLLKMCQSLKVN